MGRLKRARTSEQNMRLGSARLGPGGEVEKAHALPILSARTLFSQHGVPKSGLWKGFSGAPAVA